MRHVKLVQKLGGLLLALSLLLSLVLPVNAADPKGSITLDYPVEGVVFSLYRVADYDAVTDSYTLTGQFKDYKVDLFSDNAASSLENYVWADGLKEDSYGATDKDGQLVFENVTTGGYLIVGETTEIEDGYFYEPVPTLISLPQWQEGKPVWDIDVEGKHESSEVPLFNNVALCMMFEPTATAPKDELEVEVDKDGEEYQTVKVREDEDWTKTITDVEKGEYSVKPEVPEGYVVDVSKHVKDDTLVFDIEYDQLTEKTNSPDAAPGTKSSNTQTPAKSGTTRIITGTSATRTSTTTLPKTGQNWTLVSGLAGAGLMIMLVGMIRYRRYNDEDEEA